VCLEVTMTAITSCTDLACLQAINHQPSLLLYAPLSVHYLLSSCMFGINKYGHVVVVLLFTKATNPALVEYEGKSLLKLQHSMCHLVLLQLSRELDFGFCHLGRSIAVIQKS